MKLAEFDLEATEREFESYLVRLHRKSGDPFFDLLYTPSKPSTSHRKPRLVDGDAGTRSKEGSGVETFKSLLCVGISFVMTSFLWSSACALVSHTGMRPTKLLAYGVILALMLAMLGFHNFVTGEAAAPGAEKGAD